MVTTFSGALREALKRAMREDERVFLMGEDIGEYGGIYKVTRGLADEFGTARVIDTPMAEITIAGSGVGAAIAGMRPVVEIMYGDFLPIAMDQIMNNAAKYFFLSGGRTSVPLVIRANFGSGKAEGALQSQTPEAWFMNTPGLKIVMPSEPQDAYDLLLSAIRDDNPVLFFEHKMLYPEKGELDTGRGLQGLGKASVKRGGTDITVVSCGLMARRSMDAADSLQSDGISVEVVDVRTLKPLDEETICLSVSKTGRVLVVEENPRTGGWGLSVVDAVVSGCFASLKAAPRRLAALDVPLPAARVLEEATVPSIESIRREISELVKNNK